VCDSDKVALYQGLTATKSGKLKEIAINMAAGNQTMPVHIDVLVNDLFAQTFVPSFGGFTFSS